MKWLVFVDNQILEWPELEAYSATEVEPGVYSILYNGRSFEASITVTPDGPSVEVRGRRFLVEVADPRNYSARSHAAVNSGRQEIKSSMPGKVVRVLVALGDQVLAGQGLVVVEAMKMQNEMKASRDGAVTRVAVADGDTVGAGDILVTVE
jgi:biotin carboxyl carrier protein